MNNMNNGSGNATDFFDMLKSAGIVSCGMITVNGVRKLSNLSGIPLGDLSQGTVEVTLDEMNAKRQEELCLLKKSHENSEAHAPLDSINFGLFKSMAGGKHKNARKELVSDTGLCLYQGSMPIGQLLLVMGYFTKGELRRVDESRQRIILSRGNPGDDKLAADLPRQTRKAASKLMELNANVVIWMNFDRYQKWCQINFVVQDWDVPEVPADDTPPPFYIDQIGEGLEVVALSTAWVNDRLDAIKEALDEQKKPRRSKPRPEFGTIAERVSPDVVADLSEKFANRE